MIKSFRKSNEDVYDFTSELILKTSHKQQKRRKPHVSTSSTEPQIRVLNTATEVCLAAHCASA